MHEHSEVDWRSREGDRLAAIVFPRRSFAPEEYPSLHSYAKHLERQRAMFRWTLDQRSDLFVTIKFNEMLRDAELRQRLKRLDAVLHLYFPNGMGRSKLSAALMEKTLQTHETGRNWNTVRKLLEMAERLEASP